MASDGVYCTVGEPPLFYPPGLSTEGREYADEPLQLLLSDHYLPGK